MSGQSFLHQQTQILEIIVITLKDILPVNPAQHNMVNARFAGQSRFSCHGKFANSFRKDSKSTIGDGSVWYYFSKRYHWGRFRLVLFQQVNDSLNLGGSDCGADGQAQFLGCNLLCDWQLKVVIPCGLCVALLFVRWYGIMDERLYPILLQISLKFITFVT